MQFLSIFSLQRQPRQSLNACGRTNICSKQQRVARSDRKCWKHGSFGCTQDASNAVHGVCILQESVFSLHAKYAVSRIRWRPDVCHVNGRGRYNLTHQLLDEFLLNFYIFLSNSGHYVCKVSWYIMIVQLWHAPKEEWVWDIPSGWAMTSLRDPILRGRCSLPFSLCQEGHIALPTQMWNQRPLLLRSSLEIAAIGVGNEIPIRFCGAAVSVRGNMSKSFQGQNWLGSSITWFVDVNCETKHKKCIVLTIRKLAQKMQWFLMK